MNKYYILTLVSLITSSNFAEAESCKSDPAFQAIKDTSEAFYYPPEMIGSCAYTAHKNSDKTEEINIRNSAAEFLAINKSKVGNSIDGLSIDTDRLASNTKDISGFIKKAKDSFAKKFGSPATLDRLATAAESYSKNCVSKDVKFELIENPNHLRTAIGKDENALKKLKDGIEGNEKTNPEDFNVYSDPIQMHSTLHPQPNIKYHRIDDASLFKDNESTIDPEKLEKLKVTITDKLKKDTDPANCTRTVKAIQIFSSSSLLANTKNPNLKDSKNTDFRYKFLELSQDRAKKTQAELEKFLGNKFAVKIDPNGYNGDGSSGICPYTFKLDPKTNRVLIGMKKEIDKDHWTKEDEDNLTNSKFVKLKLELEESDGCKIDPNEENDEQKKDYSKE